MASARPPKQKGTPLRRAAAELKEGEREGGRFAEFVLGPRRQPPNDRVLVFHHIRKTAGTSLKETIFRNVPAAKRLTVAHPDAPPAELRQWWADVVGALTAGEKARLWAISSHTAGFCADLLPGRVQMITMIRDPIDRVLSRWFFRRRARAGDAWDLAELGAMYQSGKAQTRAWYNDQARTLLEPYYDIEELPYSLGPPPDADVWRTRLFSLVAGRFAVGLQEAYDESLRLFADEFGWHDLTTHSKKVNEQRPRELELDRDLAEVLRAANWLDAELHAEYGRAFASAQSIRLRAVESELRRLRIEVGAATEALNRRSV